MTTIVIFPVLGGLIAVLGVFLLWTYRWLVAERDNRVRAVKCPNCGGPNSLKLTSILKEPLGTPQKKIGHSPAGKQMNWTTETGREVSSWVCSDCQHSVSESKRYTRIY